MNENNSLTDKKQTDKETSKERKIEKNITQTKPPISTNQQTSITQQEMKASN